MAWLVERKDAISAINKVRGLGFGDAKLVYEELSKVMAYQYLRDEDIKMVKERHNLGDDFRKHLDFLKSDGIIRFEEPISRRTEYEKEQQAEAKRFEEAMSWMAGLSGKEQEMIQTIINGNRLVCSGN